MRTRPRIAVIGAGAFGGWSALHLQQRGADVTLIDAWGPGNVRSSSGGETRVIRAVYGADRMYVELVARAFEWWLELSSAREEPLYVETGTLWMHRRDDAYVRCSLPIMEKLGFPIEQVPLSAAVQRYPQIDFDGVTSVWLEHRSGILSAQRACLAVANAFQKLGGSYRTGRVMPPAIERGPMKSVELDDGSTIEADAFLFACGPWLGTMFPGIVGERIRPTRQEIFYFGTPAGSLRYCPALLPVWLDFGERVLYGMPDLHGRGFKVADDTRGADFDPTNGDRTPSREGLERARTLLAERFPELSAAPLVHAEVCQYENSPDGHLIIDRHPHADNVWLAGGGSGHGFKLSPAVGELVANAMLSGADLPELFGLSRLGTTRANTTQFEHD